MAEIINEKKVKKTADLRTYKREYMREYMRKHNKGEKLNYVITFPKDYKHEDVEEFHKFIKEFAEGLNIQVNYYTPGRKKITESQGEEVVQQNVEEKPIKQQKEIISRFREILSQE